MPLTSAYHPARAHQNLDSRFYDAVSPASFPHHKIRWRHQAWAARLGLGALSDAEWIDHFGRFQLLPDNISVPLALRYHGHQFRHYNPDLGDGRGFLFAQLIDPISGRLLDLGTKGSGQTPWSRFGDGRLTLKGGVREILATEMLSAYGVNTSNSFSLIETGEALTRYDEPSPTRASVLVRLSHSHLRIGTFQRFAYLKDDAAIDQLITHIITYYMPDLARYTGAERILHFYARVIENVARTTAQWMACGFVHGVLNTDNINITGESFDYGPWRFVPTFDPHFTAAYFDEYGLYAFGRQMEAVKWSLARLAECLLPFAANTQLTTALARYDDHFKAHYAKMVFAHLGLTPHNDDRDHHFIQSWLTFLLRTQIPFAQAHFDWHGGQMRHDHAQRSPSAANYQHEDFAPVRAAMASYTPRPLSPDAETYFARATPCTMLIDEVEAIWAPIAQNDDWSSFEAKIAEIAQMKAALDPENTA